MKSANNERGKWGDRESRRTERLNEQERIRTVKIEKPNTGLLSCIHLELSAGSAQAPSQR